MVFGNPQFKKKHEKCSKIALAIPHLHWISTFGAQTRVLRPEVACKSCQSQNGPYRRCGDIGDKIDNIFILDFFFSGFIDKTPKFNEKLWFLHFSDEARLQFFGRKMKSGRWNELKSLFFKQLVPTGGATLVVSRKTCYFFFLQKLCKLKKYFFPKSELFRGF